MSTPLYHQISEKAFQEHVRKQALYRGWLFYHTYDSRRSASGFPDCVMTRGDRLIFAELKSGKGKVSHEQGRWLDMLGCGNRDRRWEVYVWRPSDIEKIEEILK